MSITQAVNSRWGWQMSAEEEKLANGALLAEYIEAAKSLALLQSKAHDLAKLFLGLSTLLSPDRIWNISLESYKPHLSEKTYEEVVNLKSNIQQGQSEVSRLRGRVNDSGLGHLLK
jgi:hypothetical protein